MSNDEEITEGGFVKMELDLDQDSVRQMIVLWVEENLRPESQELFNDLAITDNPQEALWAAVVNDQLVKALEAKIKDVENEIKEDV